MKAALALLIAFATAGLAEAQQPSDLTPIRRTSPVTAIDRQTVQRWVDAQMDQLFASQAVEADGQKMQADMLQHWAAADATPAFKEALARAAADAAAKRYTPATAAGGEALPVVYALLVLKTFGDPAAFDFYRRAIADPAPGVRVVAAQGLLAVRGRLNEQQWRTLVGDVQKAAEANRLDPISLQWICRLLAADAATQGQAALPAVRAILDRRLTSFDQGNDIPAAADGDAAAWLAAKALAAQNTQWQADTQRVAKVLSYSVFAIVSQKAAPGRREQLERLVVSLEPQLIHIAKAKASPRPPPNVAQALLDAGPTQGQKMLAELDKWIGSASGAAGLLNAAPFSMPVGLNLQRPTTAPASAPATQVAG